MFPNAAGLGGAGGAGADGTPKDDGKPTDIGYQIYLKECYSRNEAKGYPMSNLFIGDSHLGCKSDADEQLLLHLSFHEFVKVSVYCSTVYA